MGEKSEVLFSIFGVLDITGEVVTMWIILALVAIISLIVKHNLKERPGKFQNMVETGVEYLDNFFEGLLGKKKARQNFAFLGSLFVFIIFSNYTGLLPGGHDRLCKGTHRFPIHHPGVGCHHLLLLAVFGSADGAQALLYPIC